MNVYLSCWKEVAIFGWHPRASWSWLISCMVLPPTVILTIGAAQLLSRSSFGGCFLLADWYLCLLLRGGTVFKAFVCTCNLEGLSWQYNLNILVQCFSGLPCPLHIILTFFFFFFLFFVPFYFVIKPMSDKGILNEWICVWQAILINPFVQVPIYLNCSRRTWT